MNYLRNLCLLLLIATLAFATSDRDNPRKKHLKTKDENANQIRFDKQEDMTEQETISAEKDKEKQKTESRVMQLRAGTLTLENVFENVTNSSRSTPNFTEYTVCSTGCDYDDVATAINDVPDSSTIYITEPGTYTVVGVKITDKSIWIRGLGPELSILSGAVNFEDLSDDILFFEKADYADWTAAENQDRIADSVWITRGDDMPIFNAAVEGYDDWTSTSDIPTGTLWAQGRTADLDSSDYENFIPMTGSCPPCIKGQILSLKLPYAGVDSSDVFYDLVFTQWTEDGNGGGFAYYRGAPGADLPSMGAMFTIADTTDNDESVFVRFSNLTLSDGQGSNGQSGGVYVEEGTGLEIELMDVVAENHTGGFFRSEADDIELSVDNSIFRNNESSNDGGVFYIDGGDFTFSNSLFENNVSNNGGVFYYYDGNLILYNCEFNNNNAGYRGVIYNGYGSLSISNSQFSYNTSYRGGAIYVNRGTDLIIHNSEFTHNTSGREGGAIYLENKAIGYFYETDFTQNSAGDEGGAIYLENDYDDFELDLEFHFCNFINNSAASDGGAIFSNDDDDGRVKIYSSLFDGNTAANDGGAFYIDDDGDFYIESTSFIRNSAGYNGGAIYNDDADSPGLRIVNSSFSLNSANDDGGAIYNDDYLFIYNSSISLNSAGYSFGGITYADDMSSSIIANNTADSSYHDIEYVSSSGHNFIGNLGEGEFSLDTSGVDWVGGYIDSIGTIDSTSIANGVNAYNDVLNPQHVLVDDGETLPYLLAYPGSLLIDNGQNSYMFEGARFELNFDMRGMPREWPNTADIGAVERHPGDQHQDQTAPNAVDDLGVVTSLNGGVELSWTAVGADEDEGTAFEYALFYHTENFDSETDSGLMEISINVSPSISGSPETYYLQGLDYNTEYFIAIEVMDEIGQSSGLSNLANITTIGAPVVELSVAGITITMPQNSEGSQMITLSNSGEANLSFSGSVETGDDGANSSLLLGTGSGGAMADLYWFDPITGAVDTLLRLDGIDHLTGLSQNPQTKVWYGSESDGGLFSFEPGDSTINFIGSHTSTGNIPDIDFAPDGTLYGWSEGCDCLTTIDLETAESNQFGQEISSWQTGFAIDQNGQGYMKAGDNFYWIDLETGSSTKMISLDLSPHNMLDIGSDGQFYTGIRSGSNFIIATIDTSNGTVNEIDTLAVSSVAALAIGASGWASLDPRAGVIASDETISLNIEVNTIGLSDSTYTGLLSLSTNDPNQTSIEIPITLTVSSDGNPPLLVTESLPNAIEDANYSFQLEAYDENLDDIIYTLNTGPDWLTISESGEITGLPDNYDVGDSLAISVNLSDGILNTDAVLSIMVENTNDTPVLVNALDDIVVDEDSDLMEIDLSAVFGDEDISIGMDSLTYSIQGYLTFRKVNNSDWTLEENQDRVNDNVWITRGNSQAIFNIAQEDGYSGSSGSPLGTEWSFGYVSENSDLTFQDFKAGVNNSPPNAIGKPLVMHTVDDDHYYDMMIHQWTGGGGGGGFAYTRLSPENGETPILTPEINGSTLTLHFHPEAFGETELVVVATDQAGISASDSINVTINSVNDIPGDFALLSPEDDVMLTDLTPTFHWEEATDIDDGRSTSGKTDVSSTILGTQTDSRSISGYHFFISLDDAFTGIVPDTVMTNSYTPSADLSEDEAYYWKVEAVDNDGGVTSSAVWSFWMNHENSAPEEFVLLTPVDGDELTSLSPTFTWHASSDLDMNDVLSYTLDLGESIDSLSSVYTGTDTSFTVADLSDNTTYYWKVLATDLSGATTVNTDGYHSFIINGGNDAPSMVNLISPDSVIVLTLAPEFHWTEAIDPDPNDSISYELFWMNSLETQVDSAISETNSMSLAFSLEDNAEYSWWVKSTDGEDGVSESESAIFWTDLVPEAPLAFNTISPVDSAVGLTENVTFSWDISVDPDPIDLVSYTLVYATDANDSSTYVMIPTAEETTTMSTLANNTEYFWWVMANDEDGLSTQSNDGEVNSIVVGTLAIDPNSLIPNVFALHQNYPNPFNPTTTLQYDLPEDAQVNIMIYDLMGREVKTLVNNKQTAGFKSVLWDATNNLGQPVSAGMYLYRISAGNFHQVKKMILLK